MLGKKHGKWYNDGLIEKMFKEDEIIPSTFKPGRLKMKDETRIKMSQSLKGKTSHPAWNKGLTKETDEKLAELSKHLKGYNKGVPKSEETRQKMKTAHEGKESPKGFPCRCP